MDLFDLTAKIMVDDSGFTSKIKTCVQVGAAAVTAIGAGLASITKQSVEAFSEYEQLAGGAAKIFDELDQTAILKDAADAYQTLGMSANEYLSTINDVGAAFASTMGDAAGYDTAKAGLQAISDYASGTGKDLSALTEKYTMITRSTSSYQSIADQFSGILPATSAAFLEQAQAAGLLSEKYESLTEVPIDEYQSAVTEMLGKGVDALGLTGNTLAEANDTISGSLAATKAAWQNLITGFADSNSDVEQLTQNLLTSAENVFKNIIPVVERILPSLVTAFTSIVNEVIAILPSIIKDDLPLLIEGAEELITGLVTGIEQALPELLPVVQDLLSAFAGFIMTNLPTLVSVALQIVVALGQFVAENAPTMIPMIVELVMDIAEMLIDNIELLIEASIAIIVGLAQGLVDAAPKLSERAPELIEALIMGLVNSIPALLSAAVTLLGALVTGFLENIEMLINLGETLIDDLMESIDSGKALEKGKELIDKLLEGIKGAWETLKGWVTSAWDSLVSHFTIDSSDVKTTGGKQRATGTQRASGLDYVPYNGYPAVLHRGEAVLTSSQASSWRNGGGAANTINIYPQALDNSTVDYLYARFNAQMGASV